MQRSITIFMHHRKGFQRIWLFLYQRNTKLKTRIAVRNTAHIIKDHRSLSWAKMCPISYSEIKLRLPKIQNNMQEAHSHLHLWNSFTVMTPEMLAMLLNRKEELTVSNTLVFNYIYPKLYQIITITIFLSSEENQRSQI